MTLICDEARGESNGLFESQLEYHAPYMLLSRKLQGLVVISNFLTSA